MTTGRINQVAFLGDTTTRTTPAAVETRGRGGRRLILEKKSARARAGASGGGARWTGTGAPLLGPPRASETRGGEGQLHIRVPPKWVRSTGTPPRRKAPRGPWA